MRVLITGGAGFIGSHFCEHILLNTDWHIVSLDRLDTSGNLNRLSDLSIWQKESKRVSIIFHDLKAEVNRQLSKQIGTVHVILHLAASSHVDRSIDDPLSFVMDNVVGTAHILEFARRLDSLHSFIYFGTDEVFGPAPPGVLYKEWDRYKSGNPYSATKAGAEELCVAYENTYKMPIIMSHCMNVIGERQDGEKMVPSTIRKVLSGETVIIHADPTCTIPGSRFYIHARNVADATLFLLDNSIVGEKYNIVGEREVNNLELAQKIADILEEPLHYQLVNFHSSRPGHDLRYALSGEKMAEMGWKPPVTFEQSLEKTVRWIVKHPAWL